MEISHHKSGDLLVISLNGRLDANWCGHVENALTAAIRGGEHHIHLNLEAVSYVSSAGLRVLLGPDKQLRSIQGTFGVIKPSPSVRSVLELAGLGTVIVAEGEAAAIVPQTVGSQAQSAQAVYEVFDDPAAKDKMRLTLFTGADGRSDKIVVEENDFALGIGALGAEVEHCAARWGEFLAIGGTATFQPSDGGNRPDFFSREGDFFPQAHISVGLAGRGDFPLLARFEATGAQGTVGLTELAGKALELSGASAAVVVVAAEAAGLVGATLRQPPEAGENFPFEFPGIRDWLSFTSERAYRDTTSLIVGVIARPGSVLDPLLRPDEAGLMAHFHAAAFPYRPLQKGCIHLQKWTAEIFFNSPVQSVLHLISDPRGFNGAGESEFYRGALWIAPLTDLTLP